MFNPVHNAFEEAKNKLHDFDDAVCEAMHVCPPVERVIRHLGELDTVMLYNEGVPATPGYCVRSPVPCRFGCNASFTHRRADDGEPLR